MIDVAGARVLARAGLLTPTRPDRLLGMGLALLRWGITPATGYAAGANRHPNRLAIVDDAGSLTWRDVDQRTDRLASELRARGLREGQAVGLLARNGRGLVEGAVALAKAGADVLYLNTGSAADPLAQVLEREGARMVLHDEELRGLVPPHLTGITTEQLADLALTSTLGAPPKPRHTSRQVILTSGTTGAPRGAARSGATVEDAVAALSAIPLRGRETTVLAAPAFHAWGLGHLSLAMLLGSTVVLQRRFDARPRAGRGAGAPRDRAGRRAGHAREAARRHEGAGVRRLVPARHRLAAAARCPATWSSACRPCSARCSTTSTARPRWRTPRSRPRRTSPRTRAPRGGRRSA